MTAEQKIDVVKRFTEIRYPNIFEYKIVIPPDANGKIGMRLPNDIEKIRAHVLRSCIYLSVEVDLVASIVVLKVKMGSERDLRRNMPSIQKGLENIMKSTTTLPILI